MSEWPSIPSRLAITIVANDEDYVLIDVSAADGRFAGATELYGGDECTRQIAIGLQGFPRTPEDRHVVVLGSKEQSVAGGWVEIVCRCLDLAGHVMLEISIVDKYREQPLEERTVRVHLPVEASAIDMFVEQLSRWDHAPGSWVALPRAT